MLVYALNNAALHQSSRGRLLDSCKAAAAILQTIMAAVTSLPDNHLCLTVLNLARWRRAAWQTQTADPSLPVGAAIAFSVWRLFDKRKKRAPEGTDLGRSPIWGALGVTLLGLVAGFLVRHFALKTVLLKVIFEATNMGRPF